MKYNKLHRNWKSKDSVNGGKVSQVSSDRRRSSETVSQATMRPVLFVSSSFLMKVSQTKKRTRPPPCRFPLFVVRASQRKRRLAVRVDGVWGEQVNACGNGERYYGPKERCLRPCGRNIVLFTWRRSEPSWQLEIQQASSKLEVKTYS